MSDKKVNPDDAPEGYIAVAQMWGLGCEGCNLYGSYQCLANRCYLEDRVDGCNVIFIKKEK